MIRFFSKNFWVVHLLFIAAAAWLIASFFSLLIDHQLASLPPSEGPRGNPVRVSQKVEPYEKYAPILERNIFSPGDKGLQLLPLAERRKNQKGPGASKGGAQEGSGGYKLLGTVTGPKDRSWAILQDQGSRKQEIHRSRETLSGGKIVQILRNQISIERDGKTETLTISEGPEAAGPRRGPRPAAPPPKGEVVNRLSANRFVVNREDVTAAVGNINQFMTQARLKPHFDKGRPVGYSVTEIKPGSLMEKLGLKNFDIVKKVNGMVVTRPEEVMQAYSQLQRDSNIELEIERGGRSEVLHYEIR
jgi:general secretion pathway protein C